MSGGMTMNQNSCNDEWIVSLWRGKRSDEMENGTERNELLVLPCKQIYTAL
jgi:hypothetical protein